jgi:hypothetical protein
VVSAYEQRISVLERVKVLLRERLDKRAAPKTLGGSFAFAMRFLSSPWRAWKNADLALRTTVRSAAFLGAPAAQSEAGTSNPRNRLYFKVSGDLTTMKCEMAHLDEISSNTLFDTLQEWEDHLASIGFESPTCDDDKFAP